MFSLPTNIHQHFTGLGWKSLFVSSLERTRIIRVVGDTKYRIVLCFILMCASAIGWAQDSDDGPRVNFDIPQQRADLALMEFAEQADLTLMVPHDLVQDKEASALVGEYTLQDGIDVLLAGTGLSPTFSDHIVLSISTDQVSAEKGEEMNIKKRAGFAAFLAGLFSVSAGAQEPVNTDDEAEVELEEIIVTGSHIRRTLDSASSLIVITREDIDLLGISTSKDLVRSLPQNFAGGPDEGSFGLTGSGNNRENINDSFGTGINLRSLGSDSTLVLLNGQRNAPSGAGTFTDISMIPLNAIERVEILPDGASAIYGSDAVGGAVNFVLRDDYEGAEVRLRYGDITGDSQETVIGLAYGAQWDSGQALFTYENYQRDFLDGKDRSYTVDAPPPYYLLPEQDRDSFLISAKQDITSRVQLFGHATYSERKVENRRGSFASPDQFSLTLADVEQYSVLLGATVEFDNSWRAELTGSVSNNTTINDITQFRPTSTDRFFFVDDESDLSSIGLTADGSLFHISGGDVKAAIGSGYREEEYISVSNSFPVDSKRNSTYVFGELLVPFVGKENRAPGFERLELTLAGRYEDYSGSVGSSFDPKIGLLWSPSNSVSFHTTYGTSFRAPTLEDLNGSQLQGVLANIPDPDAPDPPGTTLTVLAFGNNADLVPETATTWTAGFDFEFESIPALKIGIDFFDIDFEDKIEGAVAFFDAFTNPQFAARVTRSSAPGFPDASFLAFLETLPFSLDFFTGAAFTDAEAFVDNRLLNIATVKVSGVDLSISYGLDTQLGRFDFMFNSTYLNEKELQIDSESAAFDVLNTVNNPVDIKLRTSVFWSGENMSAGLYIDYLGDYEDIRTVSAVSVDSWTTVGMNLTYTTDRDLAFSLSAQNLFNEDPPFVEDVNNAFINFDAANASPIGRYVALQLTKQFSF